MYKLLDYYGVIYSVVLIPLSGVTFLSLFLLFIVEAYNPKVEVFISDVITNDYFSQTQSLLICIFISGRGKSNFMHLNVLKRWAK